MTWRWGDRVALGFAWFAGIGLCLIAAAIVLYMGYRGVEYLRPNLLFGRPSISTAQNGTGGFLDPLLGTGLLTLIGIVLAVAPAPGPARSSRASRSWPGRRTS
jgi:phosphate transport system permease protein